MKSVLADLADVVLVLGVEVQNTVKAIYGADILAGRGPLRLAAQERPRLLLPRLVLRPRRRGYAKFGEEAVRAAMAQWFVNAIEAARRCPKAQEHHNADAGSPRARAPRRPNPSAFVEHINVFDCSKVSDGAAAVLVALGRRAGEGRDRPARRGRDRRLRRTSVADLTAAARGPDDARDEPLAPSGRRYAMAGIGARDLGFVEVHDCFSITGVLMAEAIGICSHGEGYDFVTAGGTTAARARCR